VLATGKLDLSSFAHEQLNDPEILSLAAKVHMDEKRVENGFEGRFAVETRSGDIVTETVETVPVLRTKEVTLASLRPKLEACLSVGEKPVPTENFLAALAELESLGPKPLLALL
jgi:RNase P/RNase MRP subunit p29